jgi:hypothetical protein
MGGIWILKLVSNKYIIFGFENQNETMRSVQQNRVVIIIIHRLVCKNPYAL